MSNCWRGLVSTSVPSAKISLWVILWPKSCCKFQNTALCKHPVEPNQCRCHTIFSQGLWLFHHKRVLFRQKRSLLRQCSSFDRRCLFLQTLTFVTPPRPPALTSALWPPIRLKPVDLGPLGAAEIACLRPSLTDKKRHCKKVHVCRKKVIYAGTSPCLLVTICRPVGELQVEGDRDWKVIYSSEPCEWGKSYASLWQIHDSFKFKPQNQIKSEKKRELKST